MYNESIVWGLVMTVLLIWISVSFLKWAYNRTQRLKESNFARKIKSSATSAIAKSATGISNAAKAGASLARQQRDSGSRYDDLLKLKQLLDAGAVTTDEYEVEKRRILDS